MAVSCHTVALDGVDARPVEVQCALSPGLPAFSIVGLPDKAVSEARERVRAALSALSISLPSKRITINLAPADLPKEGSHFDLPIALRCYLRSTCCPRTRSPIRSPWESCPLTDGLSPFRGHCPPR